MRILDILTDVSAHRVARESDGLGYETRKAD